MKHLDIPIDQRNLLTRLNSASQCLNNLIYKSSNSLFVFQANKTKRGYSSQFSLDSIGTVPDLTDRVIRVSFAPTGTQEEAPNRGAESAATNQVPDSPSSSDSQAQDRSNLNDSLDQDSVSAISIGKIIFCRLRN